MISTHLPKEAGSYRRRAFHAIPAASASTRRTKLGTAKESFSALTYATDHEDLSCKSIHIPS